MIPIVTMSKGMFPDIAPFLTIRSPCSGAKIDGSLIILNYIWINLDTLESGFVPGNAGCVLADSSPVVLLTGQVPTHIGGGGPVLGE